MELFKLFNDSLDSKLYFLALGYAERSNGNYEKSDEYHQKAFSIDSSHGDLSLYNAHILQLLGECKSNIGQFEESLKYYKKWLTILKSRGEINYNYMHRVGYAYYKNGYVKEADYYFNLQMEYCDSLINSNRPHAQEYLTYYDRAGLYAFRGEKQKAYADLNIFNQRQRNGLWLVTLIKNDPLFDSIRNEPEFQQIIRDVEAKYQAEHKRVRKWLEEQGA